MGNTKKIELDKYEKWIEIEIEKGRFIPIKNFGEWKKHSKRQLAKHLKNLRRKKKERTAY